MSYHLRFQFYNININDLVMLFKMSFPKSLTGNLYLQNHEIPTKSMGGNNILAIELKSIYSVKKIF